MQNNKTYDFNKQLNAGTEGELVLDNYFQKTHEITPATPGQQRQGIDRLFKHKGLGTITTVEYKTDLIAHKTKNAFIETVAVEKLNYLKAGWVHTTQADWLIYYIEGIKLVYVFKPVMLRKNLDDWTRTFPAREVSNSDWVTKGILVPLAELKKAAATSFHIN